MSSVCLTQVGVTSRDHSSQTVSYLNTALMCDLLIKKTNWSARGLFVCCSSGQLCFDSWAWGLFSVLCCVCMLHNKPAIYLFYSQYFFPFKFPDRFISVL